jgi:hypothetical protein
MPPTRTKTSAGMETVDETVKRAQNLIKTNIQPTVSANDLVNPPAKIAPPVPTPSTNDGSRLNTLIGNVATNTQSFITSQSEEAAKAKELASLLGTQTFDGAGQRAELGEQYGIPANLARLTDIQTQLTKRNTESELTKSRIEGAAGQTLGQAGREITQEDRESAVRDAGLAAEASVLSGSIETASTIINQAMTDYYADRTATNQNMLNQLNYFSGIAAGQEKQLLEQGERIYQEEQNKLQLVQNSVSKALASGVTTPNEIKMLTNPNTTDDERLALAQLIEARGAVEMRDMEKQAANYDLAIKAEQLSKLRQPTVATRDTSIVDVNGSKQLVDTQSGEVIATFGSDVSTDEIQNAKDVQFVNTLDSLKGHPGMNKAVGTNALARWTPFKADVMTGQVSDFVGSVENVVKQLTLNTFAEAKEKGITFGATSQGEWDILGNTATKISSWKRTREDGSIFYETSEKNMNKELDTLSNFGKMDAIKKGVNPSDIGVIKTEDGLFWTKNSDGSMTQLPVTP